VLVALLLLAAVGVAAGDERLADPTKAFVEGYDPSGNDFLANVPERTVLLRIRADLDGDGRPDLALSDSSTWGNAGGQWLLFRGQPDGAYVYWGTLFFAPGTAALRAGGELLLYVRTSASRGALETYRLTAAAIARTAARATRRHCSQARACPWSHASCSTTAASQRPAGAPASDCSRVIENRHGSAGALRTCGGLGAMSGPPCRSSERHGSAGALRTCGGLGAMSGPHVDQRLNLATRSMTRTRTLLARLCTVRSWPGNVERSTPA